MSEERNETNITNGNCVCQETEEQCNCGSERKERGRCGCGNRSRSAKVQRLLDEADEAAECNRKIGAEELQEIYRNATVGMQSVEILRPLSEDKGFRNVLLKQYKGYAATARELEVYAEEYDVELNDPSVFAKGMMYFTTMVNTIKDKSNGKLAEIMIQGINMGIISLTKLINKLSDEGKSNAYADDMLELLEHNLNEMKLFL